jgi:4-amino-4-deoxy-L-arabinose transferase-like glycosyltransferase
MAMDLSPRASGTTSGTTSGTVTGTPSTDVLAAPDAAARPGQETRSERRELTRIFLVLLALTFVLRFPAFFTPVFNSDETFLATQAHVLNDGGQLYEEAIDRKPPVVPYVYAATFAFFDTTALWSVRVVAMLAVALTALLLAIEARRRYGARAGWIAGILFVVAMVSFAPQDGQAANFEVFMLPSMTAAILFARRGKGFLAGVAIAAATLAKQTGAATLIPVVYVIARARGKRGVGEVFLGFTIPTALVALAMGPAQLLYWTVLGNGSYVGMRTMSTAVLTTFLFMTGMWALCNLPLLWKIPSAWKARRLPAFDGGRDTDLWLWLLSAALSVAVGLRFFGHYYLQMIPPLALLAAGALSRSSELLAKRAVAFTLVIGVLFSAAGYFIRPGVPEPNYESVARYLATTTNPDDAIYVWGSVPEIYWASERRPATRFLTSSFLTGNYPGRPPDDANTGSDTDNAWEDFYEDFKAHPPKYFVDTSPAKVRGAQYYPISEFPRLAHIVDTEYKYVVTIDGIDVYARK